MAKVRVVEQQGLSSVVEYRQGGVPYRVVVSTDAIEDGEVPDEFLALAPTYGTNFHAFALEVAKEHFDPETIAESVAAELAKLNIWDFDDLARNKREARMIVTSLFGSYFAKLLTKVAEHERD
jgi:hypothetical protein